MAGFATLFFCPLNTLASGRIEHQPSPPRAGLHGLPFPPHSCDWRLSRARRAGLGCRSAASRGTDRWFERGAGSEQGGSVRRGAGNIAAARVGKSPTSEHPIPGRNSGDRSIAAARRVRREARRIAGRGHRRAPRHAGAAARAGARPPGARPRLLPQGRGQAGEAAFRAGAGRQAAGGGGAQRQPLPQHHAGAQTLEPARRRRAPARHQYRHRLGPADHLYQRPPLPPQPGATHHLGRRHLGLAGRGNTSTRSATPERGPGQAAGVCARAATSRAGNTGRASSTR